MIMKYTLNQILTQYSDKNTENKYEAVAVGKYGIRKRSEIYKKELAEDYSKNKLIYKDTLTIALGSKQIDFGVLKEDAVYSVSPAYTTFKINTEIISPEYLELFFTANNLSLTQKYMIASARQGKKVDINNMLKESIDIPDFDIQKKIVNNISLIYSAQAKDKILLELMDELVKSRFMEMFGNPISNSYNLPELTLPELGELGRGVSKHRPRNDPELLGGNYPLIQTGDVANAGLYITSYDSTYSELGLKQSKMWNKGTLCITIAANIAKTSILDFDACFPDSVVGFIANEKTNNIFIHYWFSFFQSILEAQAPESAQKNINLKILSELKVIVPKKEKQEIFASFVHKIEESKNEIQKRIDLYKELLNKKMNEYFG